MPKLIYTTNILYNSSVTQINDGAQVLINSFLTGVPTWSNTEGYPIPNDLIVSNIGILTSRTDISLTYNLFVNFTGTQSCTYAAGGCGGVGLKFEINYQGGGPLPIEIRDNCNCGAFTCDDYNWNLQNYRLFDSGIPYTINTCPINAFASCGNFGCNFSGNNSIIGATISFTLVVTATILCSGVNLNNSVCTSVCNSPDSLNQCFQDYLQYCLNDPTNSSDFIFSNQACINFFSNYITTEGPRSELDVSLDKTCSPYDFTTLDAPTQSTTQLELNRRNICACHLPEFQYVNYQNQLEALYPGFTNLGLNQYCLVSACATSSFKRTDTGKVCALPNCLNIVEFNNNGTFNNSTVEINQTNSQCANITGNSSSNGSNTRTIPTYVYIGVLLLVLVLLFIGTALIYYG
jgi:hypothetical protein